MHKMVRDDNGIKKINIEFEASYHDMLVETVQAIEDDPYRPRPGCDIRLVKGHPHVRAVRVGDYRGIYEVVEEEKAVWFTKFGPRRSVYG